MYTPLCFCLWHALYAMYARFELECTIYILSVDFQDNLLEPTRGAFVHIHHRNTPTPVLAVLIIHTIEISCKDRRLIPSCSCTDFHHCIFAIFRILRNEQELDFLLQLRKSLLSFFQLEACHFCHFLIASVLDNFFSFSDISRYNNVFLTLIHQLFQILIFLGKLHITLLVGYNIWLYNKVGNLIKSLLYNI